MSNRIVMALAATAGVVGSATAGQVFGNLANFQAAVPTAVLNDFNTVADGFAPSVSYNFGAFAYEISATNGLFNNGGTISTNSPSDALLITFTSGDVRAFGGDWWGTDFDFNQIQAQITITLDDGTSETFNTNPNNGPRFGGYMSDSSILSISIAANNSQGADAFPTMDNFRVAVVPLPPAAWAGLGMLGLIGGVRAARRRG